MNCASWYDKLRKQALIRAAGVYSATNIFNASLPFLLMPILTRYLTPSDYGVTAMLQMLIGLLTPLIGLSLHGAVAVEYHKKAHCEFSRYVTCCLFISLGCAGAAALILSLTASRVQQWTSFPADWLWAVALICCGQFLIQIALTFLQVSVRPKLYALIQISQTALNLTITLILVVFLHFGWQGRVIAQVAAVIFFAAICTVLLKKWKLLRMPGDIKYMMDALKFGLPLIPHALSAYLLTMADRMFIANMVGIEETGVYAAGAQIAMAIYLLASSFNQAYSPWLYRNLRCADEAMKRKIVKYTYIYFFAALAAAAAFSLAMPPLMRFFLGAEFYRAQDYIPGIALAGAFRGMYFMVVNYIFYTGKTQYLAAITCFVGLIHILVTYWAVRWAGGLGAAYSSAFTAMLLFVLVWSLSAKIFPMPWFSVCSMRKRQNK